MIVYPDRFLLRARMSHRRQGGLASGSATFARSIDITISPWYAATSPKSRRYALVDNWQYRLLRAYTPGPYTFMLKASRETPRRLKHERRGTIGLRVPDHPVTALLLDELGEPVMSSTLLLPGEELPRTDAKEIYERLEPQRRFGARRRQLRPHADLGYRLSGRPRGRAARGPRRRRPFVGLGNRIMRAQRAVNELSSF